MTLALIAGQGGLPPQLVRALLARGEVPVICEIEQFPSDVKGELPRLGFRLETLGSFIATAKEIGVTRVCMAGAMHRPPIDPAKIDAATLPLVPKVQAALTNSGDDSTLRIFTKIFEEAGLEVIGAAEIDPSLLPPEGVTGTLPKGVERDISVAEAALVDLAAADKGQAVVVRDGAVIAREDARGTDAMLGDLCPETPSHWLSDDPFEIVGDVLGSVADWLSGPVAEARAAEDKSEGGLLFKAPKAGQELRVDMPLIGLGTVMRAAEAGLAGIVIEAGGVMLLDPDGVAEVLRSQGMFLWVRPRTEA
ncbi:LpxI family protein [Roseovarius atlanticus]|uniref:LpxI family protein n=1 Tax=Roseovarius atlanticus TaxID=1641875 RepID=UPI001C974AA0|nr:UDP-2,3-diacylglucosamine diphosphatase LpxI [Roseovarius atlanticus]MBY5988704.1 UDP-2,3-diacylglucosamine diphosphatase LpxI [Roseovarius atlanticus]MBY6124095.1 UDP-2,3-diacylglucosamine diphosphatase LpxI [Roseovarius atlanticus]MBY6148590.1 UDP-2,3-diacylglucosamine diphosphatase LpxI [Roseovarius atlanticus]